MTDFLCQIKILLLNMLKLFFNKIFFDGDEKFYLYDRFFVSNQNFTS